MIFSQIDGKTLDKLSHNEMRDFLVEHIFFKFMDSGRAGLAAAATDVVDNLCAFQEAHNPDLKKKQISQDDFKAIRDYATKQLINDLITQGTSGWPGTILSVGMYIANSRK